MTSNKYIFAGAPSKIAIETAKLLKQQGQKVIGISTKPGNDYFDEFHAIENYDFEEFPIIDEPVDGLVYFPGTLI